MPSCSLIMPPDMVASVRPMGPPIMPRRMVGPLWLTSVRGMRAMIATRPVVRPLWLASMRGVRPTIVTRCIGAMATMILPVGPSGMLG